MLDEQGNGSFKNYVESVVLASAQRVLDKGEDPGDKAWLTIQEGKARKMLCSEHPTPTVVTLRHTA